MELKMLTGLCGPDVSLTRGDPYTCDDFEAVRLVRAGFAKPEDPEAFEKAAAEFDIAAAVSDAIENGELDQEGQIAASAKAIADGTDAEVAKPLAGGDGASKAEAVAQKAPDDAPATPKPASGRAKARS